MLPETTTLPNPNMPFRLVTHQDSQLSDLFCQIARHACPPTNRLERRSQQRIPYSRLIRLAPVSENGALEHTPVFVIGKHVAPQGLDFYHHEAIPHRLVIASLETNPDRWVHLLMKITWCRFLQAGWYDSGGKFTKVVDWSELNANESLPVCQSMTSNSTILS